MIIDNECDVTTAVLAEAARTPDARLRELLTAAVTHLHAFVREARLTEPEFQKLCALIARAGQITTASHNEVVLGAGALGVSALVCLLNNWEPGGHDTTANLMGPFWRAGSPRMPSGASIVRSPTPGLPLFVDAWVQERDGTPVADATVEVWHASTEGYYENQDPSQADMNLRGSFTTDRRGHFGFRSVKPAGYPIPVDGPVGDLLRAQGRHNWRPAHVHFMIHKAGYKTQFSQVYVPDDPHLESDAAFGVTRALIGDYVLNTEGPAPDGSTPGPWVALAQRFIVERGESRQPKPPISGKSNAPRPQLAVLPRRQ
jgi:hydroxyquinol 1,2-dioxygenase